MKQLLLSAGLICMTVFAFAQNGERSKDYPRFEKETQKRTRDNARGSFQQRFEMQAEDDLRGDKSEKDQIGFTHDKYQQYYKNVKVEGAVYTVHSKNNVIESYSGEFKGIRSFDVIPSISASQGLDAAMRHAGGTTYAWDNSVKAGYPDYAKPTGELVIIGGGANDVEDLTLAWKYDIYSVEPLYRAEVYINAKTGDYVRENLLIHTANATATGIATLYNGAQNITTDMVSATSYRLRETRGTNSGIETYNLNKGTNYATATDFTSADNINWSDKVGVQAHFGAEKTYDYYLNTHGRNSFNNAGAKILSYVHYSTNYINAFWDGTRMTYGDGGTSSTSGVTYKPLVSLDICGHEITHGVTTYSSNLTYSNESGALNESFSDIFGECIENYAKGGGGAIGQNINDWYMSCDIGLNGCGAFRSMENPNQFSHPDTYKGTYWYTGTADGGGVHTNSGVQNKWFYILTKGESGTNDKGFAYTVTGIGIDKAAKIAYRNLTLYLTASSNYAAAREGAIQSAIDLFGAGSAEVIATTDAWNAVGVYAPTADAIAPSVSTLSSTAKTQTTVSLSWTAATDNIGIVSYEIYRDGIIIGSTSSTTRTFIASGLSLETAYNFTVKAKDAAGNRTSSNILNVTTWPQVSETLVSGYSFTNDLEAWVASSATNCIWSNNASFAYEGSGAALVQAKSTTATSPTVSLSGYSQVEVKFYFYAAGMEANKTFTLLYSSNNGSTYSTIGTFTSATTASGTKFKTDNGFYVATVTMNSTAFTATTKFRIQNGGATNDATDKIYFDKFTILGRKYTTGTGNVVTLAAANKVALLPISGAMNLSTSSIDEIRSTQIYPNPVGTQLNIQTNAQVKAIRLFNANGTMVKSIAGKSGYSSIDMSKMSKGVYFAEIISADGVVRKKIIKQ